MAFGAIDVTSWHDGSVQRRWLSLDPGRPDPEALRTAVEALAAGEVVAFPTDTLYGLAVDPRRSDAARRLFAVKRRPAGQAVPLIAADSDQVTLIAREVTPLARRLADRWWPGPMSIVLDASPELDRHLLTESGTVAVRVPAHRLARRLAADFQHPVTATSANRSGQPPPADAAAVDAGLGPELAVLVDGGPARGGAPSTIVDARGDVPVLVREGAVEWDRVLQSLA
jgi:L-threonylcarbamoyladenylate synthase